ncbi:hypothetical protein JAAARDRAFT_54591 [Jaapia argillacea MUCL 33604]|uniref:NADP-dependent oxidoreductase domain-containing protein n=1 Tax=Jaapia argillacea MUCL 33604 TaxID=933084 RepID=A0A067QGP1_9AGAM|nr:hypothetical protein JAAARDRAFT_54591 [Jaapia argillacea MUCL 33604]
MPFQDVPLNDGHELPSIAFGTGTSLFGQDATEGVELAIETGFCHIDTSAIYGNEDSVGNAIRESGLPRDELYITTKYDGGDVSQAIETSLAKLGLKYVDLYLIHQPYLVDNNMEAVWREFERAKEAGLAKSIGVSNFNVEQLQRLLKIAKTKPAVNQIQFDPYTYAESKALLEYSAENGIVTQAYGSLLPITRTPGGAVDKPLADAAKRLHATPGQVIFKWVLSKGVVIVTTSSKKTRLEEYLAVADLPPLYAAEITAIDEAGAKGPPQSIRQHLYLGACTTLVLFALARVFWALI